MCVYLHVHTYVVVDSWHTSQRNTRVRMRRCIDTYIYTYIKVCVCIFVHTYVVVASWNTSQWNNYVSMCRYIHTYIHKSIRTRMCMCVYVYIRMLSGSPGPPHNVTPMLACVRIFDRYVHTYLLYARIDIHVCLYMYTYTCCSTIHNKTSIHMCGNAYMCVYMYIRMYCGGVFADLNIH